MMLPNLNQLAEQTPNINFIPFGTMSHTELGMNGLNYQGSTWETIPQYVNKIPSSPCFYMKMYENQQNLLANFWNCDILSQISSKRNSTTGYMPFSMNQTNFGPNCTNSIDTNA